MSKQVRVLYHKKEENRYPSKSISVLKDNTSDVASLSSKINEILVVLKESRIIK